MKPRAYPQPDDDPAFAAIVDRIIDSTVSSSRPPELFVVRIKNWFDHKWLRFSGIGRVEFQGGGPVHTSKEGLWRTKLTFPPFAPARVLSECYFCWTTKSYYEEQPAPALIHDKEREHSSANLQRRVVDFAERAVFVWFSSNSAHNQHGSVIVYAVDGREVDAWYASFERKEEWSVTRTKGIDRNIVEIALGQ